MKENSKKRKSPEKRKELKLKAIEFLGNKCFKCGQHFECSSVYDFHHLSNKEINLSRAIGKCINWNRLKKELDNCILLCANCHRIIHYSND